MSGTIWSTVECSAWSRGFDYDNYNNLYSLSQTLGKKASEEMYYALCAVFENEMVKDSVGVDLEWENMKPTGMEVV